MKFFRFLAFFLVSVVIVISSGWSVPSGATPCGGWIQTTGVNGTNPATGGNSLESVSALTSTDVWAAGSYTASGVAHTLVEHWNGATWSLSPALNPGAGDNQYYGVDAIASGDVWIVGGSHVGSAYVAQAQHWNGASWSNTFPLNPSATENFFSGVSSTGTSDVWAVGAKETGGTERPLVEHWAGSGWLTVPTPKPGAYDYLTGVEAISPTNVWMSGYWAPKGGSQQALVLHWNGTKFTQIPTVKFKTGTSEFWGLAAGSSKFVVAVGDRYSSSAGSTQLIEQWNKAKGRFVTMPAPHYAGNDNVFWDVTATSNSDAWLVGRAGFGGTDQAVAAGWNGSTWTNYSVVNPSVINDILIGVSMLPSGDAWAVGGEATSVSETGGVLTESFCP